MGLFVFNHFKSPPATARFNPPLPGGLNEVLISFLDFAIYHTMQSCGSGGFRWDNAVTESFFKSLKAEEVYETVYQNQKEVEIAIFEYI